MHCRCLPWIVLNLFSWILLATSCASHYRNCMLQQHLSSTTKVTNINISLIITLCSLLILHVSRPTVTKQWHLNVHYGFHTCTSRCLFYFISFGDIFIMQTPHSYLLGAQVATDRQFTKINNMFDERQHRPS